MPSVSHNNRLLLTWQAFQTHLWSPIVAKVKYTNQKVSYFFQFNDTFGHWFEALIKNIHKT